MGDASRRVVRVDLPGRPAAGYGVQIGGGLWHRAAELVSASCPAHRYALITDETVRALHADRLADLLRSHGLVVDVLAVPPGEPSKTREWWARLSDRMLDLGMGRDAAVLAVGGGVVGDLAGFVAATFMRGLPYVQVPTTLLAMIDSSVGGKTGVDTPAGKNLIGAFHQPRTVLVDPTVLGTLPRREIAAGLAEAVKHGCIADAAYFEWIEASTREILEGDPVALTRLVATSVEIKADAVARDERESGQRKSLNFGHTVGHAVESLSAYSMLHGEAIAIGMVVEARLGEALGITERGAAERIASVLSAVGLPDRLPEGWVAAEVEAATRVDKKARGGVVEYALIERVGKAHAAGGGWSVPVASERVIEALAP